MRKTRVCELLGIDYPIIQGGMAWIANAELAAAVSEAGGLGLISPSARASANTDLAENLRHEIGVARGLTRKPFGVNIPLNAPDAESLCRVLVEEKVPVVVTAAGNPRAYTGYFKEAGLKVLHVIASVRHAKTATGAGVDAIIAEGYEAGGHNGFDELSTMVLVPQVVDAVEIPVVAAGGIADARGFVAALALGAEGVQMGTAFVATHECSAHSIFKEAVLNATDVGTTITGRKLGPTRCLKNELTQKIQEMESSGASAEELQSFIGAGRAREGELEGDLVNGEGYCGAIAGLVQEMVSAAEVIQRVTKGAPQIVERLPI